MFTFGMLNCLMTIRWRAIYCYIVLVGTTMCCYILHVWIRDINNLPCYTVNQFYTYIYTLVVEYSIIVFVHCYTNWFRFIVSNIEFCVYTRVVCYSIRSQFCQSVQESRSMVVCFQWVNIKSTHLILWQSSELLLNFAPEKCFRLSTYTFRSLVI